MDSIVLHPDDQFDIKCEMHLKKMIDLIKKMTEDLMIPIKFNEYEFEKFVKNNSTIYDKMHDKYNKYYEMLENQ
jgi:hypothetical protein